MTIENQVPLILTDTTCDLLRPTLDHYGVQMIPQRIHFGDDEVYISNKEMTLDQFIERIQRPNPGVHPTTTPPTEKDFLNFYKSLIPLGRPLISIHTSITLSQTVAIARRAARQLDHPIEVVDSRMVSGSLGLQVLTAARAAAAGCTVPQILPLLDHTYEASDLFFCVDDLSYLYRGGRIGRVSYTVAQALHLKPIVTISKEEDSRGTYIPGPERPRSLKSAMGALLRATVKQVGPKNRIRVYISYSDQETCELTAYLAEQLRERFEIVYLETGPTTPLLAVHTGAKVVALAFASGPWEV